MSNNWKIDIAGVEEPVSVDQVIEFCSKENQSQLYSLRKELATQNESRSELISCHHCGTPVIVTRRKKKVYVKHKPSSSGNPPVLIEDDDTICPFYQGKGEPIFEDRPKSESKATKLLKFCISESVKLSTTILKRTVKIDKIIIDCEDGSRWRSPHVYFEKKDGTKWAIEILRSWINPTLIQERETFYKRNNIKLLWIVYTQSIGIESITFGDLMYGQSKEKNVFAFSYNTILNSFSENDFQINVFYPGDIGQDTVYSKRISFNDIKISQDGSPYYKDCSNITFESFRDYLVRTGAIDAYSTDKEVIKAVTLTNASKTINAAKRTSETFLFNKQDILKSITELNKINIKEVPSYAKEVQNLTHAFNLNLKILETVEHPDGRKRFKRHLGQISRFSNSKTVFNVLREKGIITYDDLVSDSLYLKDVIINICEKRELEFEDFLILNKARLSTRTESDAKKIRFLIEILFSSYISKAMLQNKSSDEISKKSEIVDTFRIFYYLLSLGGHSEYSSKTGILKLDYESTSKACAIFKGRKYSNDYFQTIVNVIYSALEKHRSVS